MEEECIPENPVPEEASAFDNEKGNLEIAWYISLIISS